MDPISVTALPLTRDNSPLPISILQILRQTSEASPGKVLAALKPEESTNAGEGGKIRTNEPSPRKLVALVKGDDGSENVIPPTTLILVPSAATASPTLHARLPPRAPLSTRHRAPSQTYSPPGTPSTAALSSAPSSAASSSCTVPSSEVLADLPPLTKNLRQTSSQRSDPSTPSSVASSSMEDESDFGSVSATPRSFALGASAASAANVGGGGSSLERARSASEVSTVELREEEEESDSASSSTAASADSSSSSSSSVDPAYSPRSTNKRSWFDVFTPENGTHIRRMGHAYTWTSSHPRISALESLRSRGDPDADEVLEALDCGFSADVVAIMAERAARHKITMASPPEHREASSSAEARERSIDSLCFRFLEKYSRVPEWVDWSAVRTGQLVFQRHCQSALLSLMYSSLLGGFGAPLINAVLTSTNYLSGNCPATYRRLVETTAMISACVGPDTQALEPPWVADDTAPPPPTTDGKPSAPHRGDGWLAAMRVRFLHAKVRAMLRARSDWDLETYGVPINQEDMLATLLAFSFNVPWSLTHVGLHIPPGECEEYIHAWRYIGWLSGVSPDCLEIYLASNAAAMQCSEAIMYHLVHPDETSCRMAEHVLKAVHECFPLRWSYSFHLALARALMTDEWADSLKLPQASTFARLQVRLLFFFTKSLAGVSYLHPVLRDVACRMNWTFMNGALERFNARTKAGREKREREKKAGEAVKTAHHHSLSSATTAAPYHLPPSTFHSKILATTTAFQMLSENAPSPTDEGLHLDGRRVIFPDAETCPFLAKQRSLAAQTTSTGLTVSALKAFSVYDFLCDLLNGASLRRLGLGALLLCVVVFTLRKLGVRVVPTWLANLLMLKRFSKPQTVITA